MDKVLLLAIGAIGVAVVLFFVIILSTLLGGVAGWVVGGVFPFVTDTIRGLSGLTLTNFEIGAVLGFVGGFIRSSSASSK